MCLVLIWLLLQIEELSKGRRKNSVFLPQTRKNRKREIWSILNSLEDLCWEEQINGFRSRECLIEAFKVKKEEEEEKKNMEVKQNFYGSLYLRVMEKIE